MNTRYKPLQTHGRTVKTWQPPHGDRFTEYDRRDEAWMRPLGLGRIAETPEALFDVRDERGELVGYTIHDPRDYDPREAMICILDPEGPMGFLASDRRVQKPTIRTVTIRVCRWTWPGGEYSIGWRAMLSDVPDLILVKWITVLGEDNIQRAIYDAERKVWERRQNAMYGAPS
jgi:hypothetical protein